MGSGLTALHCIVELLVMTPGWLVLFCFVGPELELLIICYLESFKVSNKLDVMSLTSNHLQVLDFTDHVWTECFLEYLGR